MVNSAGGVAGPILKGKGSSAEAVGKIESYPAGQRTLGTIVVIIQQHHM